MVTSHNQSQDSERGREERRGRLSCNHKDDSITSSISSAAHRQSLFSVQHFCNTRFNHLATILLNAVYQGKGRSAWPRLRIARLTACSEEQKPPLHQSLWVSCRSTQGHLAANTPAMLSAKNRKYVQQGVKAPWVCSSFTRYCFTDH